MGLDLGECWAVDRFKVRSATSLDSSFRPASMLEAWVGFGGHAVISPQGGLSLPF